jgi:hypothetical protein
MLRVRVAPHLLQKFASSVSGAARQRQHESVLDMRE